MKRISSYLRVGFGAVAVLAAVVSCGHVDEPIDVEVSSYSRYLAGLNETVTYVLARRGTATLKYVVRESGERQTPWVVNQAERSAYSKAFGRVDHEVVRYVDSMQVSAGIRVAVLLSSGPAPSERHLDELSRTTLALRLEGVGASQVDVPPGTFPGVFATIPAALVRTVGLWPEVSRLALAEVGVAQEYAPPSTPGNSLTVPKVDTGLNPTYTGSGERIGIVEDGDCRLYGEHDAFANTSIVEESSVSSCQTHVACQNRCGASSKCISGTCVDGHVGRIASTIAQTVNPGSFGAHKATIYHPTKGNNGDIACSEQGIVWAYAWLQTQGVTTTTESFGCESGDGMAQDWFARTHDMAVFRAAGNISAGTPDTTDYGCRPMNSVCVGGMVPSGGGYTIDSDSCWVNPSTSQSDLEEPDLVALSQDIDVIDIDTISGLPSGAPDTSSWQVRGGTSYAAPAMAAVGVLLREACDGLSHNHLRAIMMTAAWGFNPDGPAYSKPDLGIDYKDGAGALLAEHALWFCGSEETELEIQGGDIEVDLEGGEDAPPWMEASGSSSFAGPPSAQPLGVNPNAPFKIHWLATVRLGGDDRVRVTLSWDNCPTSVIGTGPAPLGADLDLFLCDPIGQTCLEVSRSYDNNNEGFDVVLPAGTPVADYDFYVGHDPASPGCGGTSTEPASWVVVAGPSSWF